MEKQNPRAKTEKEGNRSIESPSKDAERDQLPQASTEEPPPRSKQPENTGTPRDHEKP